MEVERLFLVGRDTPLRVKLLRCLMYKRQQTESFLNTNVLHQEVGEGLQEQGARIKKVGRRQRTRGTKNLSESGSGITDAFVVVIPCHVFLSIFLKFSFTLTYRNFMDDSMQILTLHLA